MDLSGAGGSIRGRASRVEIAMKYRTLHEIVSQAQRNLDRDCWDYLLGGADTEASLRRNRHGLDAWVFRPRILNDELAVADRKAGSGITEMPAHAEPVFGLRT